MITVYCDENNVKHQAVTQQYRTGLYCIYDSNPALQFNYRCSEKAFHKQLRKEYKYIPEESSVL